jgi:hypothetical protein
VLNWCISSVSCPSSISFSGIDIRCCSQLGLDFGQDNAALVLGAKIEDVIRLLYERHISSNSDCNTMHSVLFLRAIALGLRSTESAASAGRSGGSGAGQDGEDNANEGEDEEGDEGPSPSRAVQSASVLKRGSTPGVTAGGAVAAAAGNTWTTQQYCNKCRDMAVNRWLDAPTCFLRVKCLTVKMAALALNQLTYGSSSAAHSDLELAREQTRLNLQQFGAVPGDADMMGIPCFATLFLHDLVNTACACSTYTINDKVLQCLQIESIGLLQKIVLLFFQTVDPDAVDPGADKLLSQFLSQIVSSVRPCLGATYSPSLAAVSGSVICLLINGGFLSDKVAVRRLIKLLFASTDEKEKDKDRDQSVAPIQTRARASDDTSDSLAVIGHVAEVATLANLYLLTINNPLTKDVETSVRAAITSTLQEYVPSLGTVWYAMIMDGARVLQTLPKAPAAEDNSSKDNGTATVSEVERTENGHNGQKNGYSVWPEMTFETDPRRGGLVYSHDIPYSELISALRKNLPVFLAASTSSSAILTKENADVLFSTCYAAMSSLCAAYENIEDVVMHSDTNIFATQQSYLLVAMTNVCKFDLDLLGSSRNRIPVVEWANTATLLGYQLFAPKIMRFYSPTVLASTISSSIELLSILYGFVHAGDNSSDGVDASFLRTPTVDASSPTTPTKKKSPNLTKIKTSSDVLETTPEDREKLSTWLWTTSLIVATRVLPFIFAGDAATLHATIMHGELPKLASVASVVTEENTATVSSFLHAPAIDEHGRGSAGGDHSNAVSKLICLLVCLAKRGTQTQKLFAARLLTNALPVICVVLAKLKQTQRKDAIVGQWVGQLLELVKMTLPPKSDFNMRSAPEPTPEETNIVARSLGQVVMADLGAWHQRISHPDCPSTGLFAADGLSSLVDGIFAVWKQVNSLVADAVSHASFNFD